MTDLEITRQLAQVMGWEIGNGTQEEDYSAAHVYYDGNGEYWRGAGPNLSYGPMRPWRPLSSMDDAMGIVERLGERGWIYELGTGEDGHRMAFARLGQREPCYGTAATPARAICLAALETREEGNT